nr:MAG TPA: hypothetical protein [Bacteriophage sp.]
MLTIAYMYSFQLRLRQYPLRYLIGFFHRRIYEDYLSFFSILAP